jgi:uncharacterized protein
VPSLFEDMPWGSGAVLERTLERCRQTGLAVSCLPPVADIDRPEDLLQHYPDWEQGLVAEEHEQVTIRS